MTNKQKVILLGRMFTSLEYINKYVRHYYNFHEVALKAFEEARKIPGIPETNTDWQLWEIKVVPNFKRSLNYAPKALNKAKSGDLSWVASMGGSFSGLSKNMDGIRESFMDEIDPVIKNTYFHEWDITGQMGSNIDYSVSDYWDDGEILDEEITGPIDEAELLNYLKPGESLDDLG